jgi:hypothetical protein
MSVATKPTPHLKNSTFEVDVMSIFDEIDWHAVRRSYDERINVHRHMERYRREGSVRKFVISALGINDPAGNYSAAEHGLGPKILAANINPEKQVFELAGKFAALENARSVPELIKSAQIKYLQIGVGSEISCMVKPSVCWVANTRTLWTHLVVKHADNVAKADAQLRLYREADLDSEMEYSMWSAIHAELSVALTRIGEKGEEMAMKNGVKPGEILFLWADAIASYLYDMHHG